MKHTVALAQALTNLRHNGDFKVFLEALEEDEQEEIHRALTSEGATCHRAQGAALKLQQLMALNTEAPTVLERFKNQPKKQ